MGVEAVGAGADVRANDAELADFEIVKGEFRSNADAPVYRFERCIAVEKVEGEAEGLVEEKLLAAAEEIAGAGLGSADV
jgi:hypothetical protein